MGPWAPLRVVIALLGDARTARDKLWVALYFASRLRIFGVAAPVALRPRPRRLRWRSAPTPLSVSVESGGLSAWYETSILQVYAPERRFVPQPGWTVVDVGANIGAFSVWAAAKIGRSGRLVAVEPNPVSFRELQRSIEELTVDATAFAVACGDVEGEVTLHFQPGYTVSSSLTSFAAATESTTVPMRRLDALLGESGISHVDLLKIDVEGAEELVLRGAGEALVRIDRVVLETTHDEIGRGVRAVMDGSGFTLVHDESRHWSIAGLELLAFERSAGPARGIGSRTAGDAADPDRHDGEADRSEQHDQPERHG
jgi:FkbM family methyltransferase